MIITNLIKKIKGEMVREGETIIYVIIIILVGVSSFFLGKLSNSSHEIKENSQSYSIIEDVKAKDEPVLKEKNYVASKNGKAYYSMNCSGYNRIKEENRVWFNTKEEAEGSGFVMASGCKE